MDFVNITYSGTKWQYITILESELVIYFVNITDLNTK